MWMRRRARWSGEPVSLTRRDRDFIEGCRRLCHLDCFWPPISPSPAPFVPPKPVSPTPKPHPAQPWPAGPDPKEPLRPQSPPARAPLPRNLRQNPGNPQHPRPFCCFHRNPQSASRLRPPPSQLPLPSLRRCRLFARHGLSLNCRAFAWRHAWSPTNETHHPVLHTPG